MGVFSTIEDLSGGLITKLPENGTNGLDPVVKVEMLGLDVEQKGVFGMEIHERAVALIALGDEILSFLIPIRICSQDRDFGPDVMRGRLCPDLEDVSSE